MAGVLIAAFVAFVGVVIQYTLIESHKGTGTIKAPRMISLSPSAVSAINAAVTSNKSLAVADPQSSVGALPQTL